MNRAMVAVGRVDEFPVGQFTLRRVEGVEIGIIRLRDGAFRAVRNHCPHKGAPVCRGQVGGTWLPSDPGAMAYGMEGRVLTCPWHGYEFDLDTGQELFQSAPTRLRMFPVSVENGAVLITL